MKINTNNYGQQAVNETIACRLHERLGWQNYIPYEIEMIRINGEELPCCLTPSFTSPDTELVSAYQLIKNYKIPNDQSEYEAIIHVAAQNGMEEGQVRAQLEYMILTDFILSNTDRHYNNFGFLYSSQEHRLIKWHLHMTPETVFFMIKTSYLLTLIYLISELILSVKKKLICLLT